MPFQKIFLNFLQNQLFMKLHFRLFIILIAIFTITAIGFYFWSSNNNKIEKHTKNTISQPNSQDISKPSPTTSSTPSINNKKELNVEKDCLDKKGKTKEDIDIDGKPITVCILEDGFECKEWGPFHVADCIKK